VFHWRRCWIWNCREKQILRLIRRKDESKMKIIVSRFAMSGGWDTTALEFSF
jgi:hypothetical protein